MLPGIGRRNTMTRRLPSDPGRSNASMVSPSRNGRPRHGCCRVCWRVLLGEEEGYSPVTCRVYQRDAPVPSLVSWFCCATPSASLPFKPQKARLATIQASALDDAVLATEESEGPAAPACRNDGSVDGRDNH